MTVTMPEIGHFYALAYVVACYFIAICSAFMLCFNSRHRIMRMLGVLLALLVIFAGVEFLS